MRHLKPRCTVREGRTVACNAGSAAVIIKAVIAAALLKDGIREVTPGALPNTKLIRAIRQAIKDYYSGRVKDRFWVVHENASGFKDGDLLPGDQVWFKNPYYRGRFTGEQGSNVFYIGGGKVIELYPHGGHRIFTIEEYQRQIIRTFRSVPRNASPGEFPIEARARPKVFRP